LTVDWKIRQVSGDALATIQRRFRSPRLPSTKWRPADVAGLDRAHVAGDLDLSETPATDERVAANEIGLEILLVWRGRWCHELHRWEISRVEMPTGATWDIGEERIPPLLWDAPTRDSSQ